jgi:hypothetical protein
LGVVAAGALALGMAATLHDQHAAILLAQCAARGRQSRLAQDDTSALRLAPLRWDSEEGAFMISLRLGAGPSPVEFVLDSGSGSLSAKGPGCKWTSCGGGGGGSEGGGACTVRQCPCVSDRSGKGCAASRYVPRGQRLAPGEQGAGADTVVQFGSQEDTVTHFMEEVHMPFVPMEGCAGVRNRQRRHVSGRGAADSHTHVISGLVVHQVHAIRGSSTSNIMGLSLPTPGNTQVVLNRLTDVWCVVLYERHGWFAPHSLAACFPATRYMQLTWPRELAGFRTRFYVVQLLVLEVRPGGGGGGGGGRDDDDETAWLPVPDAPTLVIFDTGTTCCYTEPGLGARMREASGYCPRTSGLRLTLRGAGLGAQPVHITYTAQELRDTEAPDELPGFLCDPETTLEGYAAIFGGARVLLLGAGAMRNRYWEHDLSRGRLGVCNLG